MIPTNLFIFNLDLFSKKYVENFYFILNAPFKLKKLIIWIRNVYGARQFLNVSYFVRIVPFLENVQFKRRKINDISSEITIGCEGHLVKVQLN